MHTKAGLTSHGQLYQKSRNFSSNVSNAAGYNARLLCNIYHMLHVRFMMVSVSDGTECILKLAGDR